MRANLSVTFRRVGVRKAEVIQDELVGLMEKHDVKSSGMRVDGFDVSNERLYKKIAKPNYILQFEDCSCGLLSILNAYIHKFGKLPIKYKSERFNKLCEDCGCGYGGTDPCINLEPAFKLLNMWGTETNITTKKRLKAWILKQFRLDRLVAFSMWHPRWNGHSILLTGYDKTCDSFEVINAQLYSSTCPVEYIGWAELSKLHVPNCGKPLTLGFN